MCGSRDFRSVMLQKQRLDANHNADQERKGLIADHAYREAGRRLKVALVRYQLARAGVDRTPKEVLNDPGQGWEELTERLLTEMTPDSSSSMNRSSFEPAGGGLEAIQ